MAIGFVTGVLVATTRAWGAARSCSARSCSRIPSARGPTVGTDLVHALFLSAAATVGHAAAGRVDFALAGLVLCGAIPGVLIGARMSIVVPERTLRTGLATVLLFLGIHLAMFGGAHGISMAYGGIW